MLGVPVVARAQPAPYHRYRTLETLHFRIHAAEGLEREGRVAGAAAEQAYARLAQELTPPRGPIDLVVSDDADYSNGFASTIPTNRIVIFATPPIDQSGLRLNEDWIGIVVTHELTHIFHLDRVRGFWAGAQSVFGRAPFLFPNMYGPSWLTEGLAVYYESRLTKGGRLNDAEERMVARAAAAEGRLPQLNELSLGSPRFPGGQGAYAYGSLFVDYLARTRGDTAVRAFVERQSAQLNPVWLNRAAEQAFGISFSEAFEHWRDSVMKSLGAPRPPLDGWRELTSHGYYAMSPRWLNDTTLVYTGTDGRATVAAYSVTTNRVRTRLGRRTGLGANVPLANGDLLYAELEFSAPSEIRSDLYRTMNGRVVRLTRDARLTQPDARRDGTIVAVRLEPARSSLVLLNGDGTNARDLRTAGPDETWSEPRWSPDGREIAVVHRGHGGAFSLEVIDTVAGRRPRVILESGSSVMSSPTWTPDGRRIVYVREDSGSYQLTLGVARLTDSTYAMPRTFDPPLISPDLAPDGRLLAAVALRADGYHIGIAPSPVRATAGRPPFSIEGIVVPPDTQVLAVGPYRDYTAWRSVLPRYWFPIIGSSPASTGTRLGAQTSGADVLRRHLYDAYLAVSTTGRFSVGGLFYRYAGLRRPLVDVSLSQDWTSFGIVNNQNGVQVGNLLKRRQDVSLAATFVRPRVRTFSSLTAGLGAERRSFGSDPKALLAQLDTSFARSYTFPRAFVGASWTNVQRPPLSISLEDGVALAATFRERVRSDDITTTASSSIVGAVSGYKSLDLPGFAHHVLALRLAGGIADKRAGTALEVGGTSGSTVELVPGYVAGEGRRTFGVRGFPGASVYGTSAAAASIEYRAPLLLGGRGLWLLPFFFDRSSITAFADAGAAGCASQPLYQSICSPPQLLNHTLASVGGELGLSAAVLEWDSPQSIRIGVAVPVAGRELVGAKAVSVYVAFGLSF
ncbi:MAG: hypothetical protein M3Z10_09000 [Gemmatimonadota bacterium]|nr:hypothetical protein [Gemmatimonadota bacterium]